MNELNEKLSTEQGKIDDEPLLAAGIKEAVEILSSEMNLSLHYSKYPQDRWKNEPEQKEISVLISTAEFHSKRWQQLKQVIDKLISFSIACS
jgi:hypothetical protein